MRPENISKIKKKWLEPELSLHLRSVVRGGLNPDQDLVHERAGIFVSSEQNIGIFHELVPDQVAQCVILFIDGEYCSIRHLTGKLLLPAGHSVVLPWCPALWLSSFHRQITRKTQMSGEHSYSTSVKKILYSSRVRVREGKQIAGRGIFGKLPAKEKES